MSTSPLSLPSVDTSLDVEITPDMVNTALAAARAAMSASPSDSSMSSKASSMGAPRPTSAASGLLRASPAPIAEEDGSAGESADDDVPSEMQESSTSSASSNGRGGGRGRGGAAAMSAAARKRGNNDTAAEDGDAAHDDDDDAHHRDADASMHQILEVTVDHGYDDDQAGGVELVSPARGGNQRNDDNDSSMDAILSVTVDHGHHHLDDILKVTPSNAAVVANATTAAGGGDDNNADMDNILSVTPSNAAAEAAGSGKPKRKTFDYAVAAIADAFGEDATDDDDGAAANDDDENDPDYVPKGAVAAATEEEGDSSDDDDDDDASEYSEYTEETVSEYEELSYCTADDHTKGQHHQPLEDETEAEEGEGAEGASATAEESLAEGSAAASVPPPVAGVGSKPEQGAVASLILSFEGVDEKAEAEVPSSSTAADGGGAQEEGRAAEQLAGAGPDETDLAPETLTLTRTESEPAAGLKAIAAAGLDAIAAAGRDAITASSADEGSRAEPKLTAKEAEVETDTDPTTTTTKPEEDYPRSDIHQILSVSSEESEGDTDNDDDKGEEEEEEEARRREPTAAGPTTAADIVSAAMSAAEASFDCESFDQEEEQQQRQRQQHETTRAGAVHFPPPAIDEGGAESDDSDDGDEMLARVRAEIANAKALATGGKAGAAAATNSAKAATLHEHEQREQEEAEARNSNGGAALTVESKSDSFEDAVDMIANEFGGDEQAVVGGDEDGRRAEPQTQQQQQQQHAKSSTPKGSTPKGMTTNSFIFAPKEGVTKEEESATTAADAKPTAASEQQQPALAPVVKRTPPRSDWWNAVPGPSDEKVGGDAGVGAAQTQEGQKSPAVGNHWWNDNAEGGEEAEGAETKKKKNGGELKAAAAAPSPRASSTPKAAPSARASTQQQAKQPTSPAVNNQWWRNEPSPTDDGRNKDKKQQAAAAFAAKKPEPLKVSSIPLQQGGGHRPPTPTKGPTPRASPSPRGGGSSPSFFKGGGPTRRPPSPAAKENSQGLGNNQELVDQSNRGVEFRNPFPLPPEQKRPRAAADILKTHAEEPSSIDVKWTAPNAQLLELLGAARGSSVARRSNACGALKVLASHKAKRYHLARTSGVLDALMFAAVQECDATNETARDARTRAVTTLLFLAELKENRTLLLRYDNLMECLLTVVTSDASEARMHACRVVAVLSKSPKNKDGIMEVPNLVTTLSRVVLGKVGGDGTLLAGDAAMAREALVNGLQVDTTTAGGAARNEPQDISPKKSKSPNSRPSRSSAGGKNNPAHEDESRSAPSSKRGGKKHGKGARKRGDEKPGKVFASMRQQNDDKFEEYLFLARMNSCAALCQLAKNCTTASGLCENSECIDNIVTVCVEFDSAIHTRCLELVCHLTRFPKNNAILAKKARNIDTLVSCGKSKLDEDRVWSVRSFQNLSSDASSRMLLATGPILTLLTVSAMRRDINEQRAAVAALFNLSTEPGAIVPLTNTKNVVATLVHIAHNTEADSEVCRMACDALATIGLWLQTLAGAGTVPGKIKKVPLPSHSSSGWMRWEN